MADIGAAAESSSSVVDTGNDCGKYVTLAHRWKTAVVL
jgi:hypothetical protein